MNLKALWDDQADMRAVHGDHFDDAPTQLYTPPQRVTAGGKAFLAAFGLGTAGAVAWLLWAPPSQHKTAGGSGTQGIVTVNAPIFNVQHSPMGTAAFATSAHLTAGTKVTLYDVVTAVNQSGQLIRVTSPSGSGWVQRQFVKAQPGATTTTTGTHGPYWAQRGKHMVVGNQVGIVDNNGFFHPNAKLTAERNAAHQGGQSSGQSSWRQWADAHGVPRNMTRAQYIAQVQAARAQQAQQAQQDGYQQPDMSSYEDPPPDDGTGDMLQPDDGSQGLGLDMGDGSDGSDFSG